MEIDFSLRLIDSEITFVGLTIVIFIFPLNFESWTIQAQVPSNLFNWGIQGRGSAGVFRHSQVVNRLLEDLYEVLDLLIKEGRCKCNNEPGLAFVHIALSYRLLLSQHFLIFFVFTRVYS